MMKYATLSLDQATMWRDALNDDDLESSTLAFGTQQPQQLVHRDGL